MPRKDGGRSPSQLVKRRLHLRLRETSRILKCGRPLTEFVLSTVSEDEFLSSFIACRQCREEMAREAEETSESDPTPSQVAGYMH